MSEGRAISLTIGTAGHVDHGKTTLVRCMTGVDTDRLEEEHRRGISIVPGYAELELPDGRRASLIDVPGHERFVRNMVAGATGVDAFLLVVASDDGVMPQTREHLDVLRVLGVERGLVALTKTDAVDSETLELARLDVEELLEDTKLSAEVYPVSGVTGEGVGDLLDALARLEPARERSSEGISRLPVDRAFVLKGIGVVVTGTLWSGEVRPGDVLYSTSGKRPRVRGVQNHGRSSELARPGARTALDVVGVEASEVEAGEVLLSYPVEPSHLIDARLRLLEGASSLRHGALVRLHHATRDVNARVRLPKGRDLAPGGDALARLRLEEPLVMLSGDRFVLRSLTPQITVGGGTVLDPYPPGRRPDEDWLAAVEAGDLARAAPMALSRSASGGMSVEEVSLLLSAATSEVSEALEAAPGVVRVGESYADAGVVKAARKRFVKALKDHAAKSPERPEITRAEARVATGLEPALADALVLALSGGEFGGGVHLSEAGVRSLGADDVPPELETEAATLLEELRRTRAEPPLVEPSPATRLLVRRGEIVALGERLFASKEAVESILEEIKTACREDGEISLSGLRDRLSTSRKFAQAWLEYADLAGVTVRTGDTRVLTRRYRG